MKAYVLMWQRVEVQSAALAQLDSSEKVANIAMSAPTHLASMEGCAWLICTPQASSHACVPLDSKAEDAKLPYHHVHHHPVVIKALVLLLAMPTLNATVLQGTQASYVTWILMIVPQVLAAMEAPAQIL